MPFAPISASASGNNEIVAAIPGKRIRVTSYVMMAAGTVNAKWRSAGTDLSGAFPLVAQAGASAPVTPSYSDSGPPKGWFETAPGEALNLNLDAAVSVGGHLSWELVN